MVGANDGKLSLNLTKVGAELVIFPINPATHLLYQKK